MLGAAADAAAQYTDLAAAMCAFQILDPLSLRYLDSLLVHIVLICLQEPYASDFVFRK